MNNKPKKKNLIHIPEPGDDFSFKVSTQKANQHLTADCDELRVSALIDLKYVSNYYFLKCFKSKKSHVILCL